MLTSGLLSAALTLALCFCSSDDVAIRWVRSCVTDLIKLPPSAATRSAIAAWETPRKLPLTATVQPVRGGGAGACAAALALAPRFGAMLATKCDATRNSLLKFGVEMTASLESVDCQTCINWPQVGEVLVQKTVCKATRQDWPGQATAVGFNLGSGVSGP